MRNVYKKPDSIYMIKKGLGKSKLLIVVICLFSLVIVSSAKEDISRFGVACYLGRAYCKGYVRGGLHASLVDWDIDRLGIISGVRMILKIHPHIGFEFLDAGYFSNSVRARFYDYHYMFNDTLNELALGVLYVGSSALVYLFRSRVTPYLIGGVGIGFGDVDRLQFIPSYGAGFQAYFCKYLGLRFDARKRIAKTHGEGTRGTYWGGHRMFVHTIIWSSQRSVTELSISLLMNLWR